MTITQTGIEKLLIITPNVFEDDRGYFFEAFNKKIFREKTGLDINFVQDNESHSTYGTLRGLHYQLPPHSQSKLVRVISGEVLDVAVDLRKDSKTYGEHFSLILSEKNKKQLFIPKGFAHGFVVLSKKTTFSYKCDDFYNFKAEGGIIYNDSTLNIDWKLDQVDLILSQKDLLLPKFGKHL